MTETAHPTDDDLLVALLDGELDASAAAALVDRLGSEAALRARLARLGAGGQGVGAALSGLLGAAPLDRLDAMLDRVEAETAPRPAKAPWRLPRWLPAPAVAALAAGLAGVWIGAAVLGPRPHETNWRDAVAEYWALTTADTLAVEPSPDQAARELALAAEKLGVPLSLTSVTLPDASFRGAMLLDYDGRPLTQIAYLDAGGGPFAYCVIKAPKAGEQPPVSVVMGGFNVVHWSGGGYARMLIGRLPAEQLKRYADVLIGKPI